MLGGPSRSGRPRSARRPCDAFCFCVATVLVCLVGVLHKSPRWPTNFVTGVETKPIYATVAHASRGAALARGASQDDSGGAEQVAMPSDDDMADLQRRLADARKRPFLPLLAIDSMCPGQRLEFTSGEPVLEEIMQEGEVAIVGRNQQGAAYPFGVTGTLNLLGPHKWELRGGRHFKIVSLGERDASGITRAKVAFVEDTVAGSDINAAKALGLLAQEWRELVEGSKFERFEGQIKQILRDLGPMPPAEEAGKRALWVAALVNPLPALGVAYEIRPAALAALTVSERLDVVTQGIKGSIMHVSGTKSLF